MDPVTHVALGAVVAHTAAHRTLGTRVLVVGAAAGASPDIDTLLSLAGDYFDELTLHRGITHSLFFAPVAGPLLGYAVWRLERRGGTQRLRAWIVALTLALLSHPLIDVTTSYGVQLLQPFSDARFAVWAMPIIDPVYTLVLLAGCLVAWRRPNWRAAPVVALALSTGYLAYAWHLGEAAADTARAELRAEGIENPEVAAFPMLLQVHYRRVVARTDAEVRTGFVSMWRPCPIAWSTAPRVRDAAVDAWRGSREGRIFEWFAMGWVHHVATAQGLVSADLRHGFTADAGESVFSTLAEFDPSGGLVRVTGVHQRSEGGFLAPGELIASAYPETCQAS